MTCPACPNPTHFFPSIYSTLLTKFLNYQTSQKGTCHSISKIVPSIELEIKKDEFQLQLRAVCAFAPGEPLFEWWLTILVLSSSK